MLKLIHSYQYLNLEKYSKFKLVDNYIKTDNNVSLLGLHGIPYDSSLYKTGINKLLIKKKSSKNTFVYDNFKFKDEINICIFVEINYNKLKEYIYYGEIIPQQEIFFNLLKNNLKQKINTNLHYKTSNIIKFNNKFHLNPIILNNNIVKIGDIYIDINLERFYLSKQEVFENTKITLGNIIISYPGGKTRNKLIDNKNKVCIITNINNIQKWTNKYNYLIIDKNNFNNITNKDLTFANVIIIDHLLFISRKYIYEWDYSNKNEKNIKYHSDNTNYFKEWLTYYETLKIYFKRNNYIETPLLFHLFKYDSIIIDDCFISPILLNLFNFKYIYYFTEKYNISLLELDNVTEMLFKLKFNKLNSEYIKSGIYYENIIVNNNLKIVTVDTKTIKKNISLKDNLSLTDNILYNSLELNTCPHRIKLDTKLSKVDCSICLEDDIKNVGCLDNCDHKFCLTCLDKLDNNNCPLCRTKFNTIYKVYSDINKLSYRLKYLTKIKNGLILSKYEQSIQKLSDFYTDNNINNNIINKKNINVNKKNNNIKNCNYLMAFKNYNLFNVKCKKVYLLEPLQENDVFFKKILEYLNIKNIIVIN